MKKNIMKIKVLTGLALLAGATLLNTGCKKYLDVNTNPNVAQDVPVDQLLPSAEVALASSMGVDLQINGSIWAQYWTQAPSSSQYKIYEQYSPSASTYDRVWGLLYSTSLEDMDRMEKKSHGRQPDTICGYCQNTESVYLPGNYRWLG